MTSLHPTDFDERFGLVRQNAALDRQLDRRMASQPRFGILRSVVHTGGAQPFEVRSGGTVFCYGMPATRHEVSGVIDHKTGAFLAIGDVVTALFALVGVQP